MISACPRQLQRQCARLIRIYKLGEHLSVSHCPPSQYRRIQINILLGIIFVSTLSCLFSGKLIHRQRTFQTKGISLLFEVSGTRARCLRIKFRICGPEVRSSASCRKMAVTDGDSSEQAISSWRPLHKGEVITFTLQNAMGLLEW